MATDVLAHITGTVWKVAKAAGDAVAEGEAVVILESMKMEMPVEAPVAGRIGRIVVAEGDAVAEGALVATIED
jgi:acetyl-CoA carboxylase biotin carboxyl carrier protein